MNKLLQDLLALQDIDTEYIGLRRRLKAAPKQLEAARAARDETLAAIEVKELAARRIAVDAQSKGIEMKKAEADIEKLKEKLNIVKNNKEFSAVKGSIIQREREKDAAETETLELMEKSEEENAALEALRSRAEEREAELASLEETIGAEEAELKDRLAELSEKRNERLAAVPDEPREMYEQILRAKRGVAITGMSGDGVCQSCFRKQPPNIENRVKIGKEVVLCTGCGRILHSVDTTNAANGAETAEPSA